MNVCHVLFHSKSIGQLKLASMHFTQINDFPFQFSMVLAMQGLMTDCVVISDLGKDRSMHGFWGKLRLPYN